MKDRWSYEISLLVKDDMRNLTLPERELRGVVNKALNAYLADNHIKEVNYIERLELEDNIYHELRGLGIIDRLMQMENINEIMINDYQNIYYEQNGVIHRFDQALANPQALYDLIDRIAALSSRAINTSNPIMDARLENGARVNVVLPPIAIDGPVITIRVFDTKMISIDQALELKTLSQEAATFLTRAVEARYNIFISGGTGSGKTTMLNILSNFIPKNERVVTIEDNAELRIIGVPNLVRLEARKHREEKLEISIGDLIRNALRMRPERIIVGEVRGPEALDMLQAMNTGHDGSISTGHANSSYDMFNRLEAMIISAKQNYPLEFIRRQISGALDIIIHLERTAKHGRRVQEISEVLGYIDGRIVLNPLFVLNTSGQEFVLERTGNRMQNVEKMRRLNCEDY